MLQSLRYVSANFFFAIPDVGWSSSLFGIHNIQSISLGLTKTNRKAVFQGETSFWFILVSIPEERNRFKSNN